MNVFVYILIVITIVLTAIIGIKQPKMHSKILIYDSQYEIVEEKQTPSVEKVIKTEELPTMPSKSTQTRVQTIMEEQEAPVTKVETKKVEQPKTTTQTTTKQAQKTPQKAKTKETKTVQTKPKVEKTKQQTTTPVQKTQTQKQVPQQQTTTKTATAPTTVKVLTAKEEEIAWNTWRSNLQNRIMRDAKLPTMPMGTVFKMSFDVDKYGKISNLQTWSTDSRYTPYAIEFIAPVIKSYQGKAILDFPQGSQRTKTTFNGGWKISSTSKYSSPSDYNDTERVNR